ncbi:MAG: sulfotransferase family protein [Acidimicrobiales bacterium]
MTDAEPVKVLYIGGTGRTGSTLLTNLLGQAPAVFAAGELTFLWYALDGDGRCSCGQRLRTCPVWTAIFDAAFTGTDEISPATMMALRRRFDSTYLPLMVSPRVRRRLLGRLGPFPDRVERAYRAIRDTTGARLVVDSSKEPHYSYILRSLRGVDVYFVHLVRDARAIAHSWSRARRERGFDGRVLMERRSPATSAVHHDVSNLAAEILWARVPARYRRVRYEDFIADPAATIRAIGEFAGEPIDPTPFVDGSRATLGPMHSAWGNPNRFMQGTIALRADDEWRLAMPAPNRWVSTILTAPFLARYGYPLRSSSSPR